jgi:hypothetical protein
VKWADNSETAGLNSEIAKSQYLFYARSQRPDANPALSGCAKRNICIETDPIAIPGRIANPLYETQLDLARLRLQVSDSLCKSLLPHSTTR